MVELRMYPMSPVALVTKIILQDDAGGAMQQAVSVLCGDRISSMCGWLWLGCSEGQVISVSVNRESVGPIWLAHAYSPTNRQ